MQEIESQPVFTLSEAECHWYHLNWPRHSAFTAYIQDDTCMLNFAFIVEIEELMQAALTEAGNDLKTLAEA